MLPKEREREGREGEEGACVQRRTGHWEGKEKVVAVVVKERAKVNSLGTNWRNEVMNI